jgi:hypothetical protein
MEQQTIGWSPKVYVPFLILLATGAALVVLGVVLPDETLRTLGYGALGSALTTGVLGRQASPGNVVGTIPAEDQLQEPPFEQHVG